MEEEDPICPEGYPDCIDPEILKMSDDIGLDPKEDEPIILDDYRVDKTKPDCTYFNPLTKAVVSPPTLRSIREGNEMLTDTYYDDDPKNAWIYAEPKGPFISVVARHEWGAINVKPSRPLRLPVSTVRFHHTGVDDDTEFPQCCHILKNLQSDSINKDGLSDLPYNFLIGSDGFLYEGRGWYVDAERSPDDPKFRSNCFEVAYIGNFKDKQPSWTMVETALDFIRHTLQTSMLSPAYKTIPLQSTAP